MSEVAQKREFVPAALAGNGTEKAMDLFPDDVIEAAHAAASTRSALPALVDPAAEMWPAMRIKSAS